MIKYGIITQDNINKPVYLGLGNIRLIVSWPHLLLVIGSQRNFHEVDLQTNRHNILKQQDCGKDNI